MHSQLDQNVNVAFYHCRGSSVSVVFSSVASTMPSIVYWGARLTDAEVTQLPAVSTRPIVKASLNKEHPVGLIAEMGAGFAGLPGIAGSRATGADFGPRFSLREAISHSKDAALDPSTGYTWLLDDVQAGLELRLTVTLHQHSDVLELAASLTNRGTEDYLLQSLRLSLPVPAHATELLRTNGRWTDEFRIVRQPWSRGAHTHSNWRGRTSHDKLPLIFAGVEGFTETVGDVWGAHLGWSGSSEVIADHLADGRRYIQLGEALFPGEVRLAAGEAYDTPAVYAVHSTSGIGQASRCFHRYLRQQMSQRPEGQPDRPVMLNTWEAVYFDHDQKKLRDLASRAAEVGVERFVLDDGWFKNRNDDTAALGDWFVDEKKYPEGLGPLINHVRGLGMEFGLWFEPEMVNPNSDLFRQNPDWALVDHRYPLALGRNQLVLNLANPDVFTYLLDRIDALLTEYDIGYIKWDMNRDLVQPTAGGAALASAQTHAMYRLIDEVRSRHASVSIESCSSGGARADFGILSRTDRVWTSDCNDALDRQSIQRGFTFAFPPELMGAHIGPPTSHTTGRTHDLSFRAATAFLGHLGIEWNLLDTDRSDRASLSAFITSYKAHRRLLHSGDWHRIETAETSTSAMGVCAADKSVAILLYAVVATPSDAVPSPLRFVGLDPDAVYTVETIDLPGGRRDFGESQPQWMMAEQAGSPAQVSGRLLMSYGLQPPVLFVESAMLIKLAVVASP